MAPSTTRARRRSLRRRFAAVVLGAVLLAACGTGETAGSTIAAPADTVAAPSPTPEQLRDQVVAAIEASDAGALEALWPSAAWDTLGSQVLEDFTPSSGDGECDRASESAGVCFVFEESFPRVLELSMELRDSRWRITAVGLESTN